MIQWPVKVPWLTFPIQSDEEVGAWQAGPRPFLAHLGPSISFPCTCYSPSLQTSVKHWQNGQHNDHPLIHLLWGVGAEKIMTFVHC